MKLCCSSRSYARAFQSGALTQLEWLDRCAGLGVDGVDFGAAHFPRTDSDYLAQLKKLCADRGVSVASVSFDAAFGDGDVDRQAASVEEWVDRAVGLGAPLLRFACGATEGPPAIAWREFIRGLKLASASAKSRNVTLAMEANDGTLVGGPAEARRALKECDSAWLRLAPHLEQLLAPADPDWESLLTEAVIAVSRGSETEIAAIPLLRRAGYIGYVIIESTGADEDAAFVAACARWRPALV
jgi:xylose isomerase-like TIM barrel protein